MNWLAYVAGAVLSWGVYGAMLHQGQVKLGSPMRALLCVGVAYFLIGVIVPNSSDLYYAEVIRAIEDSASAAQSLQRSTDVTMPRLARTMTRSPAVHFRDVFIAPGHGKRSAMRRTSLGRALLRVIARERCEFGLVLHASMWR